MHEWAYAAQKLIEYIENHICEKPSLSEMSEHIGYSPCYCSEQFHKLAGMTIREYGFSDQSTFTRAFKHAYGCAPLEYSQL